MYPFYISFPFCLFFLLQQVYWKDSINIDTVWIQGFYNVLSYISILCTAFAIYKGYKKIVTYKNSGHSLSSIRIGVLWLKRLLLLAMAVFFIWVLITIYNNFIDGDIETERITTYILWISMSLLIYWMGYQGIYHLGIFNQRKKIRENLSHLKVGCNGNGFNKGKNRYEDIDRTIRKDKLYIDPSISLSSVAECFELSEGYLSRLINKNTGLNFPNYINNLRVNEAQRLLKDPSYQNYTIVAIGLESGFNSRSAFYSSFKNHTGVIPSEYRKQANVS
ncbi:MAG: AraC family transcriptional regulator [Flavobacteriaceae bacterium]